MSNSIKEKLSGFLQDKKLWVWLVVYLFLTGAFFGIFTLVNYLLGIVPWIGVLALIATGLLWGFIQYSLRNKKMEIEEDLREKVKD